MKVRTSLSNHRVLWVVFSATIAFAVAAIGSYYVLVAGTMVRRDMGFLNMRLELRT